MKKIYLLACMLAGVSLLSAQQQHFTKGGVEMATPASLSEAHTSSAERQPAAPAVQYSNDVIIQPSATVNQRRVRISVAFNGWLYAAYNTIDTVSGNGGITIRKSTDNGLTWSTFDSYQVPGIDYPTFDIVVAGTDTNNLTLFNCGLNHNTGSGNYVLFVDRYNATTNSFIGSNYNLQNGTRPVYDIALASDYRSPAVGASPYSVGLLYSTYSSSYDSIVFLGSVDGGVSWSVRQTVATTSNYNRRVSIAYGRSASASNGRYFAAWEQIATSNARNGHIYTSRSQSTVSGSWIAPVNLDSVSSSMINLCRNPQIAVQFNNTDNDSSSCTAVVLCERDYAGNGSDYDLLGFFNKRSHYTNYWSRLDIVNTGENDLQPDITYDPGYDNFLAVYYDSTNGKLPYLVNNMNLTTPSSWISITPQYNDVTTNLVAAWPRVEINPVVNQTAHAWIAENGTRGVAMFDAEYLVTSIHNSETVNISGLFPNPAADVFNLNYTLTSEGPVVITVYTALGEAVEVRQPSAAGSGSFTEHFDASQWANGFYTVTIRSNEGVSSARMIVSHQ